MSGSGKLVAMDKKIPQTHNKVWSGQPTLCEKGIQMLMLEKVQKIEGSFKIVITDIYQKDRYNSFLITEKDWDKTG